MLMRRLLHSRLLRYLSMISLAIGILAYTGSRIVFPRFATAMSAATVTGVFPDPAVDLSVATAEPQTVVFAGGCFWGMQGVFEHLKGVSKVVAGYAGGNAETAHYDDVSSGTTGHAESVAITYDPSQISYGQLLKVYLAVAHDPTQLNRQGPDTGTQYRSAIFFSSPDQQRVSQAYINQLNRAHIFQDSIVTQVTPLNRFYAAEEYHQHYLDRHPESLYIVMNDLPKIAQLQAQFPELYKP